MRLSEGFRIARAAAIARACLAVLIVLLLVVTGMSTGSFGVVRLAEAALILLAGVALACLTQAEKQSRAEGEALGTANERARMALELHDGIIQSALAVSLELHGLSARAAKTSPPLATELTRLSDILRSETALLRDVMQGLTPRELPPAQLIEALDAIVQRFQVDTGIQARFVTALDIIDLPPRACRELTRIVQEALVNVRKHSGARNVVVELTADGGACRLSIDDDGRGFPWTGRRAFDLEPAHLSLRSIREHVRVLAGQVTVESNPGRGARIEIPFPLGSHATN